MVSCSEALGCCWLAHLGVGWRIKLCSPEAFGPTTSTTSSCKVDGPRCGPGNGSSRSVSPFCSSTTCLAMPSWKACCGTVVHIVVLVILCTTFYYSFYLHLLQLLRLIHIYIYVYMYMHLSLSRYIYIYIYVTMVWLWVEFGIGSSIPESRQPVYSRLNPMIGVVGSKVGDVMYCHVPCCAVQYGTVSVVRPRKYDVA